MESTLRTHYCRFIHASQADALELSKIDPSGVNTQEFAPRLPHRAAIARKKSLNYARNLVEQKGFEPMRKPRRA
jgi:hypothetical protein